MIDVNSKYSYSVGLRVSYKEAYDKNPSDYTALHKYILSVIYGSQFVDEEGVVNTSQINELLTSLRLIVWTSEAEAYECQFYFEICRAMGYTEDIIGWHKKYPEYMEYCLLSELSYEILAHIGLFDAAEVCCQDLVNVGVIDSDKFLCNRAYLYSRRGDREAAYRYLTERVEEANYYSSQVVMSELSKYARLAGKEDELLEFFRKAVRESKYAKWISRPYIKLCLANGLQDEALAELERLKSIILYTYSEGVINRRNQGLIRYYAGVRKLFGMTCTVAEVAAELGYVLDMDSNNVTAGLYTGATSSSGAMKPASKSGNSPWENDFNKLGNKALLRRVNKMNKPFRTYFKLFAGGEKELIYAKCIFGNFVSIVANRFNKLFGTSDYKISDYELFFETFPFYGLNGFTEDEVDEITTVLKRIGDICVQLNPYVLSRSFPTSPMLDELLSINTTVDMGNKKYQYKVSEKGQLTVFGSILLICTFLNSSEKEAFAFELAGSDTKIMAALMKQVFKTISAANDNMKESDAFTEAGRERGVFPYSFAKNFSDSFWKSSAALLRRII